MDAAGDSTPTVTKSRRKDTSAWVCTHPEDSPAMLGEMLDPRGILTIPGSLPLGLRQLVELLLLICYPFWFVFVVACWIGGRIVYAVLWVLFSPIALWSRLKDPVAYAARRQEQKAKKLDVFLRTVIPNPDRQR